MAILAICFASIGFAQALLAQGPDLSTDFFDTVDVNIVNVEVYVTDKKGNPVTGLGPEDFEVLEDGQGVEVTNFYASESGRPTTASDSDPTAPTSAPGEAAAKPKDQRLNLVIFVDNQNITPQSRNRVIDAIRGSLFFQLNPDDRVLLVSYDGQVNVRQGLTGDPELLAEALDGLVTGSSRGVHQGLDRTSILRELQQLDLEADAGGAVGGLANDVTDVLAEDVLSSIRTYTQSRFREIVLTTEVLGRFVSSLAGLEGRKALIYISDGMALRPGEALFDAWRAKVQEISPTTSVAGIESEARDSDATPLFENLGRHANANAVTFYTILAGGNSNQALSPAERGAFFSLNSPSSLGQVWTDRLEAIERSNIRGSLQIMAEATGGLATTETNAIGRALQRLKRDLDTYYSLGYKPPSNDNENHKIKVRMKDPSLKVRHRESYRNKTADEAMSDRTLSALLFEGSGENPLGIRIEFGESRKDSNGQIVVPVLVKFPIAKVLLLPQEHFHEGRVSIYVGAMDSSGGTSPIQKMPAPIRIPNDQLLTALGQVAGFRMTLVMKEEEHEVVVGVRDELGNVESTAKVSHTPGL